jgi:hypothetical protein
MFMSSDENQAIVQRFYQELWNERQIGLADELIAADCVTHQLRSGAALIGVARGPEVQPLRAITYFDPSSRAVVP